ncbi:MAG: hypothetical protein Q8O67_06475 [Deltaproteobacteria bacterium]|nr:hypothetical protein [Deltaproteobacteria bacterium]
MRMRSLLLAFVVCTPALAVPALPDCNTPVPPPAQPPFEGDVPGFGNVFLAAPPLVGAVPRNVELVLGGTLAEIALGFWRIAVVVPGFSGPGLPEIVVPSTVVNDRIVVDGGLLPANSNIRVRIEPSETHPCQGCFGAQEFNFSTTSVVDTVAPVLDDDAVTVHGFVLPSLSDQQACGFFGGDLHVLDVRLSTREPTLFTVAGRGVRTEPTVLVRRQFVDSAAQQLNLSFGRDIAFTLGEPIVVVVTARDLAGNISEPRVVRVRMRSFVDRADPELEALSCSLAAAADVAVPSVLPTHPSLRVVFPFEELPLSLRPVDNDGPEIPLVPVADVFEDARTGHVFETAREIPAGRYDVVNGPCPRCVCPECNVAPGTRVTIDDVTDASAPADPEVKAVLEDPSPDLSEGICHADDAATLIVLAPGVDDVSAPQDLVYDAVIRLKDGLPRPAGAALVPLLRANGDVVVRIPSGPFGRLVGTAFTLTLTARDAAGNTSKTTYENQGDNVDEGGCSAAPVASFLVLAGLLRRRRR